MPAAEFNSLAEMLRGAAPQNAAASDADAVSGEAVVCDADARDGDRCGDDAVVVDVLRDARLFRARLADAFDAHLARLLREIAASVLGRELRIAPCDLQALVARIVGDVPIVRVRVCASDASRLHGAEIAIDPALAPGDAIVELACGSVDARFGVRLAAVLEAFA